MVCRPGSPPRRLVARWLVSHRESENGPAFARAFDASTSRSRGGAFVTRAWRRARAARATSSTPRVKAASLALDGLEKPLNFRTNCREDAHISSSVAGGVKLCSVLMLRHMQDPPGRYLSSRDPLPSSGPPRITNPSFASEFMNEAWDAQSAWLSMDRESCQA